MVCTFWPPKILGDHYRIPEKFVEWVIPQIPEGHPSPSVLLLLFVLLFCLSLLVVVDDKVYAACCP